MCTFSIFFLRIYCSDIRWASWCLKIQIAKTWLCARALSGKWQVDNQSSASLVLLEGNHGSWWIPCTKCQWCGKRFHVSASLRIAINREMNQCVFHDMIYTSDMSQSWDMRVEKMNIWLILETQQQYRHKEPAVSVNDLQRRSRLNMYCIWKELLCYFIYAFTIPCFWLLEVCA